jgi:hypothetical protein
MALAALAWATAGATGRRITDWAGGTWVHPEGRSASRRLIDPASVASATAVEVGAAGRVVVVGLFFFEIR